MPAPAKKNKLQADAYQEVIKPGQERESLPQHLKMAPLVSLVQRRVTVTNSKEKIMPLFFQSKAENTSLMIELREYIYKM